MRAHRAPPVMVIAGPTAAGKSALALRVAERCGGEIVNADSMQVYGDLRILTARPGTAAMARVPHHLYGTLAAKQPCSAGRWLRLARPVIADIHARRRLPVVCGGTGLYVKVLMQGIAPVPPVPAAALAEACELYDRDGGVAFRQRLAVLDPDAADRLDAADRQRLVRAYSVRTATGRTLSQWQAEQTVDAEMADRFFVVLLAPARAYLYARIDARFHTMIDAGAVQEVAALRAQGLAPELPAMKALGVPEIIRHLAGESDLDTAVSAAKQATRNLAKRQSTWFRSQMRPHLIVDDCGPDAAARICRHFRRWRMIRNVKNIFL